MTCCRSESNKKWNESGFRPPLCTYRLNWARRTSWGWWDDWDDTVLQTQDSKFKPWRSEAEHATSRSRRLPTILTQRAIELPACSSRKHNADTTLVLSWAIVADAGPTLNQRCTWIILLYDCRRLWCRRGAAALATVRERNRPNCRNKWDDLRVRGLECHIGVMTLPPFEPQAFPIYTFQISSILCSLDRDVSRALIDRH